MSGVIFWLISAFIEELSLCPSDQHELEGDGRSEASAGPEAGTPIVISGHIKPYDPWLLSGAQESMKSKVNTYRRKLVELVGTLHKSFKNA